MKEKDKHSTKLNIEKLAIQTFKNIIEGSRSINGVTWNRIKNLKPKEQLQCLKQLSQQRLLYLFFIMQQTKLKVLDLFSGIGGFSLGLESTGHFETIAFCEKDQFCQKVLQKNFKNIPIEGDVRNVKGDKYKAEDYNKTSDIVEVWFDSGCTHSFVLEKRKDLQWPASMYLEGSDQHRGWFHSSLLESCGTRGRAPYESCLLYTSPSPRDQA